MRKLGIVAVNVFLLTGLALGGPAIASAAQPVPDDAPVTELSTWWNKARADNFAVATEASEKSADAADYARVRTEGYVLSEQIGDAVPLYTYWNGVRRDNFAAATPAGVKAAEGAGYTRIRVEGYVFAERVVGTVPLYTYWHSTRRDNFSTATPEGIKSAETAGYVRIRVEGYILPLGE